MPCEWNVLIPGIRNKGAPRIGIVRHRVGAYLSSLLSVTGPLGRPVRIVKLIGHAKRTPAGQICSTLLDGEEAAIVLSERNIAGGRHQLEGRHNLRHKAHSQTLLWCYWNNTAHPTISPSDDVSCPAMASSYSVI